MTEPVFWLGLSVGLVAVAILAVILTLLPAVIQLGRAAQSVERFFDTLLRELPPTLEALRLTSLEVSEIADSLDEGVKGAGQVVKQVNRSLEGARKQARGAQVNVRSFWAGVRAAWQALSSETPPTAMGNSQLRSGQAGRSFSAAVPSISLGDMGLSAGKATPEGSQPSQPDAANS
ncbi:uncharacterized protein YoxC [Thermostichus sp. MS-CIW-21]|jgi:hypothetical protein|uniref:hypothetical protein n=1 Tax=unclassified Synechococcus TaxID=2626047 RepID=UPI00006943DA|nr:MULTISPECIES: hypothetical protein [unclassified Synechococcus]ABC99567.1 conserved hypothetical protein [Synechococcus sp. JA-3-3Ab]PIK85138.1 hypothetical protein SYN63AY4M2_00870 [Synechococcus sp. 63AY4M2]PIK88388.1 hypothetical protein SYN65AY6A5_04550 [Synechococcus sp. 65AY6A5]PIK92819.1 hypothetical protein SYN65AY6LI_11730 [Synechococcus sp. 65AY6Li]PIK94178.1 hypothetical protein SYN60AY4M2_01290 [Synechococcus sp. 60AY4M2]